MAAHGVESPWRSVGHELLVLAPGHTGAEWPPIDQWAQHRRGDSVLAPCTRTVSAAVSDNRVINPSGGCRGGLADS
jgi:hypothetical protein